MRLLISLPIIAGLDLGFLPQAMPIMTRLSPTLRFHA